MTTLFADRFLSRGERRAIDLATGEAVSLRISDAGTREEQRLWTDGRARSLGVGRSRILIDFGFVGRDRRFEAYRSAARKRSHSVWDVASLQPAAAQVVEWIEDGRSTSNVLRLVSDGRCTREWVEVVAREIRLRGFVPMDVSMMQRHGELARLVAGRSVVIFDDRRSSGDGGSALCVGILKLLTPPARAISAILNAPHVRSGEPFLEVGFPSRAPVLHAAERRPSYGAARRVPVIVDSRAVAWLEEGRRLMARGRHAAAERSLRAASAAFERRGDPLHSADVLMMLGRLLLVRGRAADAEEQFARARDRFRDLGSGKAAVSACVFAGLAQTDAGRFDRAEVTLRAALTAANALGDGEVISSAGVALARNLYWQKRVAEGLRLLQTIEDRGCPRYWSLMAKLHLAAAHVDAACQCAGRARESLSADGHGDGEAVVRTVQAMMQARLGDMDALCFHARAGIAAARAERLPLQALRLRLTLIEGLLDAGLQSRARAIGRAAGAFRKIALPDPLKERIDRALVRLAQTSPLERPRTAVAAAHEAAAVFLPDHTDGVAELLAICQAVEDERAALRSVAEIVRTQIRAVAVGIFGAGKTDPIQHAIVGTMGATLARRCMEIGQPMPPERGVAGVEAAAPVLHLGRIIGAVACRWTLEGPRSSHDVVTFARIAAAACAPLLQILIERHSVPSPEGADSLELIGVSAAIQEVRRAITRAANAPFAVLIEGESGAGKELVARAIHRAGCRRDKALQSLNCAALTEELVDSELFGHAKGAFTGAVSERLGLFESADGGTVFLDEVGELSGRAQAKLLRALQEGEIRRIGENFTRSIDARLIAATNRSLAAEVQGGRFRQDLLYRLDVIRIVVPPLRERVEDIPLLGTRFWRDVAERIGSKAVLGQAALAALARYDWPGNVRELQNVLASLAVSVPVRGVVPASAMPAAIAHAVKLDSRETLDAARRRFEERFVRAALARAAGHRGHTATALGVSRQGLAKLLQRLQLP